MWKAFEQVFFEVSKIEMDKVYRFFLRYMPYRYGMLFSSKLINRSHMQFNGQNRFLAKNCKIMESFFASPQCAMMRIEDRATVIAYFLQVSSMYDCISGKFDPNTRVLLDEGFIQKSFMFVTDAKDSAEDRSYIYNYLRCIPMPEIIIWLKIDPETSYERLLTRKRGLTARLKKMGTEISIKRFLFASDTHMKDIIRWIADNTAANIIEIENSCRIQQGLKEIKRKLIVAI